MEVTRVVFKGWSPEETQGVNLRESIQELAQGGSCTLKSGVVTFDVRGVVRNIKQEGFVELILRGPENENGVFLRVIREHLLVSLNKQYEKDTPHVNITINSENREFDFDSDWKINVIREDDLTETVWALKGAGKIFQGIAKKLDAFSQRDVRKRKALLRALQMELNHDFQLLTSNPEYPDLKIGYTRLTSIACSALLNNLEAFDDAETDCQLVDALASLASHIDLYNSCVDAKHAGKDVPLSDLENDVLTKLSMEIRSLLDLINPAKSGLKKGD